MTDEEGPRYPLVLGIQPRVFATSYIPNASYFLRQGQAGFKLVILLPLSPRVLGLQSWATTFS